MFGLDPESLVARARVSTPPIHPPSLRESIWRGMIGFTLVSLGGFAPWILAGRWFYHNTGELGLYLACAIVFIGLSGVLLHKLIIGPGSLRRFYQLFSLAFLGYAVAWTLSWFALRGTTGGVVGALTGVAVMGGIVAGGFGAGNMVLKVIGTLFLTNAAGYFIGEWAYSFIKTLPEGNATGLVLSPSARASGSKIAWGLFYGLGFGAGIGLAFYICQTEVRRRLSACKAKAPVPEV